MPKPRPKPSGDSQAVDDCVRIFSSRLHMPDCSPIFAAIGAVVANYFTGPPVWLMLIGAPSTGKTVVVNACSTLPDCRKASDSHNSSAFLTFHAKRGLGGMLSGSRIEDGIQTGGIGEFGILLYPEFTSILSLPPDARTFINNVHRQIYDGEWSREFGSDGGRPLIWSGKAGALGAVTPAIDRHTLNTELGERWLYYRFPEPDQQAQANAAIAFHSESPADRKAIFSEAVQMVFEASGIKHGEVPRHLDEEESIIMSRTVRAACLLRGLSPRDHHHRDVMDLPQIEGSGRMLSALVSIYLALEKLGLRRKWCWKIVRRIAFDCAPGLRIAVVKEAISLHKSDRDLTPAALYAELPMSDGVLRRSIEDLKILKVIKYGTGSAAGKWFVDEGIARVFKEIENDR